MKISHLLAKQTVEQAALVDSFERDAESIKEFDLKEYRNTVHIKKEIVRMLRYAYDMEIEIVGDESLEKVVIFHHGILNWRDVGYKYCKVWNDLGYRCVIWDGPGWGQDKALIGHTTLGQEESNITQLIYKHIKENYNFKFHGLHGESMGGGTTLQYMKKHHGVDPFDFYVVDAGYVSFMATFDKTLWWRYKLYFNFFLDKVLKKGLKERYDIDADQLEVHPEDLQKIDVPVLNIHSKTDRWVPFEEHQKIAKWTHGMDNWHYSVYENEEHVREIYNQYDRVCVELKHISTLGEQNKKTGA